MSLARPDIRGKVYAGGKIPRMGFARSAQSVAVDGIVDPAAFHDGRGGEGDLVDVTIYRPGQTDPNAIKNGSIIVGSKWTHEMDPYTDALTDLVYEAVGRLHPAVFNECIRLALRDVYLLYSWPVGWQEDNDFASSAVDGSLNSWDWDGGKVNMTSVAKSTTGGTSLQAGQTGPRNLILTGSAAGNGYTPTSRLPVEPGMQLFHGGIGRSDGSGFASYVLWDVTNAVALETITFQSRAFQRIALETPIPANCRQVEQRIGNVTASAVTEWDCLFGHVMGEESRQLTLPYWLTKRFQFLDFGPGEYLGRENAKGLWNATGRAIKAWYPKLDYQPLSQEANASMNELQINHRAGLIATDYWLEAKRPYSDFEDLTNESETTTCDEDYIMPSVYNQLAQALMEEDPSDQRWQMLGAWAAEQLALEQVVRAHAAPEPQRSLRFIGMRQNG